VLVQVDKDKEGLGEWTFGKVKAEWNVHLPYWSSYERLEAKGMSARLGNFCFTGRITIGAGLDVVSRGISNTPPDSLDARDSFHFASCSSILVTPSSFLNRVRASFCV